jgi:hypothetical protein
VKLHIFIKDRKYQSIPWIAPVCDGATIIGMVVISDIQKAIIIVDINNNETDILLKWDACGNSTPNVLTNDWLIDYFLFYVPLKNISLIWKVTIAGEGLQNLRLCSELRAFEQGWVFIVSHLLWHGTSVFSCLIRRNAPLNRFLRHKRGCEGSILARILTGPLSVALYDPQIVHRHLPLPTCTYM